MTPPPLISQEDLERAVAVVVTDYREFLEKDPPPTSDESKAFAAWHSACRTALAHLDHLLKLLRDAGGEPSAEAAELLAQARRMMGEPEEEESGRA